MNGPGLIVTMLVLSAAILVTDMTSPRGGSREAGLFSRSAKSACPLGQRYSTYYKECVTQAAAR